MQTFYFDCDHETCPEDCSGHDLDSREDASRLGIRFAGELLQHEPQGQVDGHDLNVTVSDAQHLALFTIHASSMASPAITGSH